MNEQRKATMNKRLECVTNVAIIVSCLAVCTFLAKQTFSRPEIGQPIPDHKAGDLLAQTVDVDFATQQKTLLIAVKSSCPFCTASMPFYQHLIDVRNKAQAPVQIVVLAPESDRLSQAYIDEYGLKPDRLVPYKAGKGMRISGTPTLIEVDRGGKVGKVWKGQLSPDLEKEVVRILFGRETESGR
jgi:hypothetical protein